MRLRVKGDGLVRTEVWGREGCDVSRTAGAWGRETYDGRQGCAEMRYHLSDGSPFPGAKL